MIDLDLTYTLILLHRASSYGEVVKNDCVFDTIWAFPVLCVMKDLDEVYLQSVLLLFANIEFLVVWLCAILLKLFFFFSFPKWSSHPTCLEGASINFQQEHVHLLPYLHHHHHLLSVLKEAGVQLTRHQVPNIPHPLVTMTVPPA